MSDIHFTEEDDKRIVDSYNLALASAVRTLHGDCTAARLIAELHARLTVLEIRREKNKSNQEAVE